MPLTFAQADALFRQDRLNDLVADVEGRRFLKLRSLNRTEYLERLFQTARIAKPDVGARQLFEAAFNAGINAATVETCVREIYREEREQRRANEAELVNQLYRVQEFNWGGLPPEQPGEDHRGQLREEDHRLRSAVSVRRE